jgi:hypothetical protein
MCHNLRDAPVRRISMRHRAGVRPQQPRVMRWSHAGTCRLLCWVLDQEIGQAAQHARSLVRPGGSRLPRQCVLIIDRQRCARVTHRWIAVKGGHAKQHGIGEGGGAGSALSLPTQLHSSRSWEWLKHVARRSTVVGPQGAQKPPSASNSALHMPSYLLGFGCLGVIPK